MYHPILQLKSWAHHTHMPSMHSLSEHGSHLVHDPRFWATLAIVTLLAIFVVLGVLMGGKGPENVDLPFYNPYFPYMP